MKKTRNTMKSPSNSTIRNDTNHGKTIDLLNSLVKTHNDRMKGYETASSETDEKELESTFADFALSSHQCRLELANEIIRLGGTPLESTKLSGRIFRAWMDIKAALTGRDLRYVLDSCNTLEETAARTYQKVLKNRTVILSTRQHAMIIVHNEYIKADYTRLVCMRNAMVLTD